MFKPMQDPTPLSSEQLLAELAQNKKLLAQKDDTIKQLESGVGSCMGLNIKRFEPASKPESNLF
jgi:hypothetical protein